MSKSTLSADLLSLFDELIKEIVKELVKIPPHPINAS